MLENGKISLRQFTILVILFTVGSSILIIPAPLTIDAKHDAWISATLGVALTLLLVLLYTALGNRFPQMTLAEINETLLGKWLGKTVTLLFSSFFFLIAVANLREIGDFMTTQSMIETPIEVIEIIFLSIVVMAIRLGLEVFARAAEFFFPWAAILFLFLAAALMPDIHAENIHPVLDAGIKPVLRATIPFLGAPSWEMVIFLMIFPFVNRSKGITKAFLTGTFIGGMILILVVLLDVLVLGADLSARQVYSSLTLAKKINIGGFLERLESIMTGIWFLTLYFKMTLCLYSSLLGFAQTFKLKDYRFLPLPVGMSLLVFSLVSYPDSIYFAMFIKNTWPFYAATFGLVLPLILLGVTYFRKNQIRGENPANRYGKNKG